MGTSRWDQGRAGRAAKDFGAREVAPKKVAPPRNSRVARQVLVCPSCPPAARGREGKIHAGRAPWLRTSSGDANSNAATVLGIDPALAELTVKANLKRAALLAGPRWSGRPTGGPIGQGGGPDRSGDGQVIDGSDRSSGPCWEGRGEGNSWRHIRALARRPERVRQIGCNRQACMRKCKAPATDSPRHALAPSPMGTSWGRRTSDLWGRVAGTSVGLLPCR
jgi:hypothetical protein